MYIFIPKKVIMLNNKKLEYEQFSLNQQHELKNIETDIINFTQQLLQDTNTNRYITIVIISYKIKIIDKLYQNNTYYESLFNKNNEIILDKIRRLFNEITFL